MGAGHTRESQGERMLSGLGRVSGRPIRQWEQRLREQDISGLHAESPPSGSLAGMREAGASGGVGSFLDKTLEFCWVHSEFWGTGSACTPFLASGEQTVSFGQEVLIWTTGSLYEGR